MNVNRSRILLGIFLPTLLFAGCSDRQTFVPHLLNAREVIARAESFVSENGYTTSTVRDPSKLQPEALEFLPHEEWSSFRHDTLQPRAYGWRHGRRRGAPGWTVVFQFSHPLPKSEPTGRAVTMNLDGSDIRIEHVDIFLRAVEARN